jgi:hypothetical protein
LEYLLRHFPEGVGVFVAGRSSRNVRKRIGYLKQRFHGSPEGRGAIYPQARRWLSITAGFARLAERAAAPRQPLCLGQQGPFRDNALAFAPIDNPC